MAVIKCVWCVLLFSIVYCVELCYVFLIQFLLLFLPHTKDTDKWRERGWATGGDHNSVFITHTSLDRSLASCAAWNHFSVQKFPSPIPPYGLQQPGCILCQKLMIIFFTLSKFCDFFWNALIKTDWSLFRQLCGQSNNFQLVLDITCSLRPPGGRGLQLTFWVNSSFKLKLTLKVSLGPPAPGGL